MKWRECRDRPEGAFDIRPCQTKWTARKGGVTYEVRGTWDDPWARSGAWHWTAFGPSMLGRFTTPDAAKVACERTAEQRAREER